jgi:RHS repeat-associated protein
MNWTTVVGLPRLASITVPPNDGTIRNYTFQWNGTTGKLQSITDPAGRVLTTTITNGLLVKITAPDNLESTRYAYDGRGVLVKRIASRQQGTTKGDSAVTIYSYAHNARVTKIQVQVDSAGTLFDSTLVATWDDTTVAAPVKADSLHPATRVDGPIDGIGDAVDIVVGAFGQPVRIAQLGTGTVTRIRYDSSQTLPALVTEVRSPHPTTAGLVGRIVRLTWNERGELVQQRDSTAHLGSIGGPTDSTTYSYSDPDAPDSPSLIRNAAGQTLTIAYNGMGLPESTTDQRGHVTSYSYVNSGQFKGQLQTVTELNVPVWSETAQADATTSLSRHFSYDAGGNVQTDSLPSGIRYTYVHDNTGAVIAVYDALNMKRGIGYDAVGRVVKDTTWIAPQANPLGINPLAGCSVTWFICAITDSARAVNAGIPSLLVTTYVHSPSGLVSVTDPRQVVRSWRHDARGNVVEATDDYGHTTKAVIGVNGLLSAVVSRMGDSVRYYYDGEGRRIGMAYSGKAYTGVGTVPGDSITYVYDRLGQATRVTNGRGRLDLTYLGNGALASSVDRAGYDSVGYKYDVIGRRALRIHQDVSGSYKDSVRYTYDSHGDLDSLVVRWGAPSTMTDPRVFRFTWDALGRRKTVLYPTGTPLKVFYNYDAAGMQRRVQAVRQGAWTGADVLRFTLATSAVTPDGRILAQTFTCYAQFQVGNPCGAAGFVSDHFAFNSLGWLVRQAHEDGGQTTWIDSLRYDGSGNITWRRPTHFFPASSFHISPGHNRDSLVTTPGDPDLAIDYNNSGDRTMEVRGGGAGIWRQYFYDGLGRTAGLTTVSTVDHINQLVTDIGSCQYDPLGRQVRACNYRGLALGLDGENILRAGPWALVSGPGLDDPLIGIVRGSITRNIELFYVTDGHGRHLATAEASGTMDPDLYNGGPTGQYAGWDATGAASVAQSYGANRLSTDDAPGLAFYRNRIYDQSTGRWTQEDPVGVAGGLNLYQFNGNNPVAYTDPFGLKIEFRGTEEEKEYLRRALADAKRLLGYEAKKGNRLASNVLRNIERMEKDENRITTVSIGDVKHGNIGETSADGTSITIDYKDGARSPRGFYPTATLVHELGHSYAKLGYDPAVRFRSAFNAVQWGNALRQAIGSSCMQPITHDPTNLYPDSAGNCF